MLQSVEIDGFKSFVGQRAQIAPFTLLIGANATGKSNFVDALRFLQGMAHGWPVRDVLSGRVEGGTRVWQGIRGGARDALRHGATSFKLASTWMIDGDGYHHALETDGAEIRAEGLNNIFDAELRHGHSDPDTRLQVRWLPGSGNPQTTFSSTSTTVLKTSTASENPHAKYLRPILADMRFLDLRPDLMRDYVEKPVRGPGSGLADDGRNLSGVLWSLCQDSARRQALVDWLVELCTPEIADIDFVETEAGDVLLQVVEHDGSKVTARSMSDGTLRFLGLLAALNTMGRYSTLVVEDLDHGLHPSRIQLLVDAIASMTERQLPVEVPVIIGTTHSPQLLEATMRLPGHSHRALLFARSSGSPGTVIRDIRMIPHLDQVLERRDYAYLLGTNWLERAV